MKLFFRKSILFALITALGLAVMPFVSASAAGEMDPSMSLQGQVSNEKLEQVWARQLRAYDRLGKGFDRADVLTSRAQKLIDRADENGKDITAIQAALDAFETAVKDAHPIYESGKSIVNSHQGFDSNGKVTDAEKARETVKEMAEKLKEIRESMNGTGRAMREAIRAFREANPRLQPTSTPEGG